MSYPLLIVVALILGVSLGIIKKSLEEKEYSMIVAVLSINISLAFLYFYLN